MVRRPELGHFDGRDPEGPDVCAVAVLATLNHLWAHPVRRANDRAALRRGRVELSRNTKVCELDAPRRGEEEVGALDIAVDDGMLLLVQVAQAAQGVAAGGGNGGLVERLIEQAHHVEQRAQLTELHHDPEVTGLGAASKGTNDVFAAAALQQLELTLHVR